MVNTGKNGRYGEVPDDHYVIGRVNFSKLLVQRYLDSQGGGVTELRLRQSNLHFHKDVYEFELRKRRCLVDTWDRFCYILCMSEESISISAPEKKFRVGIFSPTEWHAGMTKPSMVVELCPVFHRSSVTFVPKIVGEEPDVMDGWESGYIADKVAVAVKAELEAEGELPSEDRATDKTWILSASEGYVRPGAYYRAVVWFVSDKPGEISALWVASADSVRRKTASVDEPKGHRYKV